MPVTFTGTLTMWKETHLNEYGLNEYEKYLAIGDRSLVQPQQTGDWLTGQRVLVTGGSGCIGAELIRQLRRTQPAQLASYSLDDMPWPWPSGVLFFAGDIRDTARLEQVMAQGWDVVFHVAAQRSPAAAETSVFYTVSTNVLGAANVFSLAERYGVQHLVAASTGKALRYYSPDVYTATKRCTEWLLSQVDIPYRSAARFTHVVDNSILLANMTAAAAAGLPIQLHGEGIIFYAQSAKESAQLLIGAGACAPPGEPVMHAITDLGDPVSLTDVAHGFAAAHGGGEIKFTGYERGYEERPFPGLYDLTTAGDVSPLINGLEAAQVKTPYPNVDAFPLAFPASDWRRALRRLETFPTRISLSALSWFVMEEAVRTADPALLRRLAAMCDRYPDLPPEHQLMAALMRKHAA